MMLFFYCMLLHKIQPVISKNNVLDVGMEKEEQNGKEGICITHSCIPLYTVYIWVGNHARVDSPQYICSYVCCCGQKKPKKQREKTPSAYPQFASQINQRMSIINVQLHFLWYCNRNTSYQVFGKPKAN